jgi:AmmeMemoRadiSam system protein B
MNSTFKPALRPLEISRYQEGEEQFFHFHDRTGIASEASLNAYLGPILSQMDGSKTIEELWEFARRLDDQMPKEWLEKLVADLDENFLLDSPRFQTEKTRFENEFNSQTVRESAYAGLSFPNKAKELKQFLAEKLAVGLDRLPERAYEAKNVRGIVTPHIDFHRGGHVEGASYLPLVENVRATEKPFDTLIVFGIAHAGIEYPFCGANKSFATPLGIMECDFEFVNDLKTGLGKKFMAEQIVHKAEHSIEFTAVFCQYFDELKSTKIVPILCGGFWESMRTKKRPELVQSEVKKFIKTLRKVVEKHEAEGKKIGFIASVDGAHVGTQFGDPTPLTTRTLKEIEFGDRKWCAAIEANDLDAFHTHFADDENRFNVDAHPAVYSILAAFPDLKGQLLDYDQAVNAPRNIVVSFASLALFEA